MITTQNFIGALKNADILKSISYSYPLLILNLASEKFDEDDYENNIELLSELTEISVEDVREAATRPLISIRYYNDENKIIPSETIADHWMALLLGASLTELDHTDQNEAVRSIHFYGYKGGQARSTTLAIVAKRLADLGRKVLVIDADIEAPSLHLLFDTAIPRLSSSLMGACDPETTPIPITAYKGANEGLVDLLGCRPSGEDFDLDFQAFALSTSLDPTILRRATTRIRSLANQSGNWEFVLIDHRTGIAPSVIPILSAFPGSAVISLRPDLLSTPATRIAKLMLEAYPSYPGAFVSFSLDPEDRREQSPRDLLLKETFLGVLASAMEKSATTEEPIDPLSLEHNYINWYFDRAFIEDHTPDFNRLSKDNQDAITDLIQITGLDQLHTITQPADAPLETVPARTPSGANDSGWFIETRDISKLMQASSAFSYIFGRKGTGKTRIYREMHKRQKGLPLLAAADYQHGGLRAQSIASQKMLEIVDRDFERFWWMLIELRLNCKSGFDDDTLSQLVSASQDILIRPDVSKIYGLAKSLHTPITLLIDGVETAVSSRDTKQFVEALFRVLNTIQNDSSVNEKIQFKLFVRPDLSVGIQNIEQQTAGRKLELRWDEASIFNYMLAEIERKAWFNLQFSSACNEITRNQTQIQEGQLDRESYERILLEIFPTKIRRNNLLTVTFFRTYFSDAVSDSSDKKSSFYPRVVGSFLDHVENICKQEPTKALDSTGRISHSILVEAFTQATDEFINEIKQELYFALELSSDSHTNHRLVDELVASLGGLQTPFHVDACIEKLQAKLGAQDVADRTLRDALRQMKDMGIFEIHPLDSNKWRAGRLFKEALRMKYVR